MGSVDTFAISAGTGSAASTKQMSGGSHAPMYDQAPSKVVETLVRKVYTFFTTSFQDLSLVFTNGLYLFVDNTTDADIDLSYDNSNTHYCVRAFSSREIIMKEAATILYAKRLTTMSVGEITFEMTR